MRMLGNNYTGEHRNIQYIVERVQPHIDFNLVLHLICILQTMTPGVQSIFLLHATIKYYKSQLKFLVLEEHSLLAHARTDSAFNFMTATVLRDTQELPCNCSTQVDRLDEHTHGIGTLID